MALRYARVCLQGTLPGGEVWSVNPAFIGNFDDSPLSITSAQAWGDAVRTGIQGVVGTDLRNLMSSSATIANVRVIGYGADGKIDVQTNSPLASPLSGDATLVHPQTTSVVLTLESGISGRSYRGRLFWPNLAGTLVSATGRLPASTCQTLANQGAAMLAAIENYAPSTNNVRAGIWSKTKLAGVEVTSVRVGDVPDSQRRRKDALTENYSIAAMP